MTDKELLLGFASCFPDAQREMMEMSINQMSPIYMATMVSKVNAARQATESAAIAIASYIDTRRMNS